jgi:hypothetical protein
VLSIDDAPQFSQRLSSAVKSPGQALVSLRYFFISYRIFSSNSMILRVFCAHRVLVDSSFPAETPASNTEADAPVRQSVASDSVNLWPEARVI